MLFLAYIGDLVAANAVCPELDKAVNRSPLGAVLIWVPFALCAAASLVMAFRYVIRIGSAERLLDASCDPTALAARGDELGLGIRMPRCGYTRVEAVLMQRWAVALVEVGRLADAAVARRRLGESLAGRRRPGRSPYGASLCMLLADVSARLGDGEAAVAYAALFSDALTRFVPGRARRTLEGDREEGLLLLAGTSMAAPSVRAGAIAAEGAAMRYPAQRLPMHG